MAKKQLVAEVLVQIAKKSRRADPGALGEGESIACQIGPKFKLCTRTATIDFLLSVKRDAASAERFQSQSLGR
jgi:hypothetical protein